MPQDTYYILTTPDSSPCPSARNLFPAWLAYRVSPGAGLLRLQNAHRLRGGLMVVSSSEGDLRPPYDPLRQAFREEKGNAPAVQQTAEPDDQVSTGRRGPVKVQ